MNLHLSDGPIRVGIIGAGLRGVKFAGHMFGADPRTSVVALHDLDPVRLDTAAAELGVTLATTDINDFLDSDIDAVAVCSPPAAHAANTIACLRAGKHVYLEKPMAPTVDECDEIAAAAVVSGRVVMIGFELRHATVFQDLKAMITSGVVGRIVSGAVVDNVSVGANYYFHGYRRRHATVHSLALEKGIHSLDLINWLVDASPVRVYASGGLNVFGGSASPELRCRTCTQTTTCGYFISLDQVAAAGTRTHADDLCVFAEEIDIADNAIAVIDYDTGARVSYTECYFAPDYTREFTFTGDRGRISAHFDNEQNFTITVIRRDGTTVHHPQRRAGGHGGSDQAIITTFIDHLTSDASVIPGLLGARDATATAVAMEASLAAEAPVRVPPARWCTEPLAHR